jgi:hypothetical protein
MVVIESEGIITTSLKDKETAIKTINELRIIPQKLLDLTTQFGINTYCFNKQLYPSWIGLMKKSNTFDGRSYDETACFLPWHKSILLYDWDFDESEYAFSTAIHEYAHALDYSLGSILKSDIYLSEIHPIIQNGWKKQKGLDLYANLNPHEYFAQAFMAYFQKDKGRYKPKIYYEHTCEELKSKDSDMYYFIDALIKTI